ncbi:MAG: YIP1 family protein [Parashewanella sp.]
MLSQFNPWKSIWFKPRYTFKKLLINKSSNIIILFAAMYGFIQAVEDLTSNGQTDTLITALLSTVTALIFGSISGVIFLYLSAFLLWWTGRWLGGKASTANIRIAIGWSYLPLVISTAITLLILILVDQTFVFSDKSLSIDSTLEWIAVITALILQITGLLLSLRIYVIGISEAQGFSVLKAIANIMCSIMVILLPSFILLWIWRLF